MKRTGQDGASSSKEHPAVWYLKKLDQIRKKKWEDFEKRNKKPKKKAKPNALKAAQRRWKRKWEVEEAEDVSNQEEVETFDYDNMHLAYDQEKIHKFNC